MNCSILSGVSFVSLSWNSAICNSRAKSAIGNWFFPDMIVLLLGVKFRDERHKVMRSKITSNILFVVPFVIYKVWNKVVVKSKAV
jgi:hypothetical protein